MKKLVILSALALAFSGAAYAKPGGAGDMDGKAASGAAQSANKMDADNHGKHMGDTQGKHMGDTKGKHMGDTKGKHKGEKNDMKADGDKK